MTRSEELRNRKKVITLHLIISLHRHPHYAPNICNMRNNKKGVVEI